MAEPRVMQFERHMSDNEALMWNLEKDPALSSWFASLTVFDSTPPMDRLKVRIANAVADVPRLRQRVAASVGRLSPPVWIDDPEFDLDYHVRRVAVPAPGEDADLYELAHKLLLDPFERTRPLWQIWLIEGLAGGRAALFQKMHHTITDGEGGVRLSLKFVDFERDAPDPEPTEIDPGDGIDGFTESVGEMVGHNLRRVGGVAARVVRSVATNPTGTAASVGDVLGELSKALRPGEGEPVGSPLWTQRTLRRWYGTISLPFDDVRRASKALGGTVNDLFVAGALAASTRYHHDREASVGALRVAMPVSTRTAGSVGGNSFALTTSDLPALADPAEAFAAVHEGLAAAKDGSSVDVLGSLSMIINLLPTSVLTAFAKDTAATVDFTVSNVRGSPVELFMVGSRIDAVYPMGPISGTGFNLTTMSYAGSLDMGIVVDAGAIEDPPALHQALVEAYAALIDLGR